MGFGIIRCQKDLRTIKRESTTENQEEIWYNMLQNGKMTEFGENYRQTLGQIM